MSDTRTQIRTKGHSQTIRSQKLEIVARQGPCFPNPNTPTSESNQLRNWDQVRVRSINKKHKAQRVPFDNEVNSDHGYNTVKIGLGTPRQDFYLMVDTGSKSTWVHCKSCTKGCKSDKPLFDPSKRSTYTNNTATCNGPFSVHYVDKSSISGTWGCDTLTGDDHDLGAIMNFRFGCGQEIDGDFGDAFGVFGLGKGESSVTSQIGSAMKMFSYYIPPRSDLNGNLYFGNEARENSNTCSNQFTPLVKDDLVNYYVDLVDEDDELLDTCYSLEGIEQFLLPEIKFHFGQGSTIDVTLTYQGKIWTPHDNKRSIMCLAFASTKGVTIIGNVQQRGFNVIYDLEGQRIGFGTKCA
ncbi:hypothetical protein T459_01238 [Capsicum annuum]|uniref:Peptidase A1 domain-containing protein n=1 Tax=Capsicum annuum TaxID=4072 RepID=A0A2G3AGI5_CAPAN|nr:hypothetical protein T459_01238 [Capsicum annuum]